MIAWIRKLSKLSSLGSTVNLLEGINYLKHQNIIENCLVVSAIPIFLWKLLAVMQVNQIF